MSLDTMMEKNITYSSPTNTVAEVAQAMKEDGVGAVLIVDAGIPKGIITDRDIVLRCTACGFDPQTITADRIMTEGVETVPVSSGIYDVVQKLKQVRVRRLAVVDDSGNAVGLLSFDDIFDLLTEELCAIRESVRPENVKLVRQVA